MTGLSGSTSVVRGVGGAGWRCRVGEGHADGAAVAVVSCGRCSDGQAIGVGRRGGWRGRSLLSAVYVETREIALGELTIGSTVWEALASMSSAIGSRRLRQPEY